MRYFAEFSYLGASYHGWQRQPGDITVQQVIEEAMSTLLRKEIKITGAGRTDTGVNARCMPAHFDFDEEIPAECDFGKRLNAILPKDIVLNRCHRTRDDFHARFDAVSRTYHYYALPKKSAFINNLVWKSPRKLNYEMMNSAAGLLLDTEDFTSFSKLHTDVKTNICHVSTARWEEADYGAKVFIITADRFLRNMVRAIVGTLVEVGLGKITIDDFHKIIQGKNRCLAGTSMPAQALYLWDVKYEPEP